MGIPLCSQPEPLPSLRVEASCTKPDRDAIDTRFLYDLTSLFIHFLPPPSSAPITLSTLHTEPGIRCLWDSMVTWTSLEPNLSAA